MSSLLLRSCYTLGVLLYLCCFLPKFLLQRLRYGKYKGTIFPRLIGKAPVPTQQPVIWFHAVSVGEAKALLPLLSLCRKAHPTAFILISTTTETGLRVAKKEATQADAYCYLPLDFSWTARRFVRRLRPNLLILIEGDYWLNLMRQVKQLGGAIIVASGKLSQRSMRRYAAVRPFSRALFSLVDHFYLQTEDYRQKFCQLDVPKEKLTVIGNLKFDLEQTPLSDQQQNLLRQKLGLTGKELLIVVGSTHAKEEAALLDSLLPLTIKHRRLKILLFPRHPERFAEVGALLKKRCPDHAIFSRGSSSPMRVILVDRIGILSQCYPLATLAIVGGSYFPGIGGHDIFEPAKRAVPVLFGPYMEKQPELTQLILLANAGYQTDLKQLRYVVDDLLSNSKQRRLMGERGEKLARKMSGTAKRHWKQLALLLNPDSPSQNHQI
ncbi:MAG: glycosyltransferase N-terminal domain-containing protein [Chlamydiota bacterium]